MLILGINFNHPETSVVLANENQLICGIEEERINRIKNFSGFPVEGIKFILKKYGLTLDDIEIYCIALLLQKNYFVLYH